MKSMAPRNFEEFAKQVKSFHGAVAPGIMIGGSMVDLAYRHLDEEGFYGAICETSKCLPDAIQLLTPCSTGNNRLKVIDVGRYALTFYDQATGKGIRVFMDSSKLDPWPEIRSWYLRLKPKKEQNSELLLKEIKEAGEAVCGFERVNVSRRFLRKGKKKPISICPSCNEAYPASGRASLCPACRGGLLPYLGGRKAGRKGPSAKKESRKE